MNIIFKTISISVILLATFILAGCNTMSGLGQDVEKGGQAIQNAAVS